MSKTASTLSHESEGAVINLDSALARHPKSRPIIVDFDGTILLRNSTEAYLDAAWPRQVAALLLAFLDLIKPWRLFPGGDRSWIYSDWTRVMALTVLLPWSLPLWQFRAPSVARRYVNTSLLKRLAPWPAGSVSVATFGFRLVVAPLLRTISPDMHLAVAGSFLSGFRLRRLGKAQALQRAIGADALSASLVITDSNDDADLVPVTAELVMIDCPPEAHRRALQDCYVPFQYMNSAKRPGENHFFRQILYRDLLILSISYALHSTYPLLVCIGLLLLQLSYWIIYEIGYWENDCIGSLYEDKPVIRAGFAKFKDRFNPAWAWGLALLIGLAGAVPLELAAATHIAHEGLPSLFSLLIIWSIWILYLCGVRLIFYVYNRIDVVTRVFLYPALQITKHFGFVVLLPISFIGAALCTTQVLVRWIPYIVYRYGGTRWMMPQALVNLTIFNLLITMLSLAIARMTVFHQPEIWFIEIWFLVHARKQIMALVHDFVWLPRRHSD
jgi:hypothetical protein